KLFFFQAEDGIRDRNVTGVQTCALPIYVPPCVILNLTKCTVLNLHSVHIALFWTTYFNADALSQKRKSFFSTLFGDRSSQSDDRSEEHTSELQSRFDLVCRLLLEKKKTN